MACFTRKPGDVERAEWVQPIGFFSYNHSVKPLSKAPRTHFCCKLQCNDVTSSADCAANPNVNAPARSAIELTSRTPGSLFAQMLHRQHRVRASGASTAFADRRVLRCWPGESFPKKVWFPQKLPHYPKATPKQAMHSERAAPELPQCPNPSRPGLGGGGARESMCLLTACRAELSRAGLYSGIGGALGQLAHCALPALG